MNIHRDATSTSGLGAIIVEHVPQPQSFSENVCSNHEPISFSARPSGEDGSKGVLEKNTEAAIESRCFMVPWFVVEKEVGKEVFWGIEKLARGRLGSVRWCGRKGAGARGCCKGEGAGDTCTRDELRMPRS